MPTNTSGGTTTSLNNTVQAKDDAFQAFEDSVYCFDVMANDLGGSAKTLWSIDTTSDDGSADLVAKDVVGCADLSELGARIWLTADGKIAYDSRALDYLPAGQVVTDQFTYAIRLSNGTLSWATVTVTLIGTNDVPVAVASSNSVLEDSSISGNVSATDADAGETATLTYALVDPASAPAGLSFNSDGSYSFDASSYDSLPAGEELVLTIPFTASDATSTSAPANLVITITGTNDVPVATAAVNAALEDGPTINGSVSATDADAGETATLTYALVDPAGAPAGLTFNSDGSYSFDPSSYDSLPAGEELVLTIAFTASDATSTSAAANLVITITGTNDVPVATAAVNAAIEDGPVINGSVSATDADAGETATLTYALADPASAPVGLTFNSDGSYSFDPSSYDSLPAGEELVLTIPFTASDATSTSAAANLVITITGTNDVPVATAAVNAVDEDASISGNVFATDVDAGETATLIYALVNPAPSGLIFNPDGSYTFDASSYDYLAEDEELVLTIPFTASDASSTSAPVNLVITITGTNDAPVAIGDVDAAVEDGPVINGSVSATDADAGETATLTYALVDPAPAGLTFNSDGSYSFDASSYDSLPAGEELVLTIPFTASDATSTSAPVNLVITITGTNDVPVAIADVDAAIEDGPTIDGSVSATDADAGETAALTYALVDPASAPAGLTFNSDGSYSFDASSYDSLPAGEELELIIPFTASDATSTSAPANLVITITGTNDPTVFTLLTGANVYENADGTPYEPETLPLDTTDGDGPDDLFVAVATPTATDGGYGSYTLTDSGDWTFVLDNDNAAVDALNEGEILDDSFTVVTADGTTQQIDIVINGVNDSAIIDGQDSGSVTEDDPTNIVTGTLTVSDVDSDETFEAQAGVAGVYGTFSIAADGQWAYELNNLDADTNNLGDEDDPTETFTVRSADGTEHQVTIAINGHDDAPVETRVNNAADDMDFDNPALIAAFNGATVRTGDFDGQGGNDIILGASADQELNGNGGGDTIHGADGADVITGGGGNDTLYGGAGGDQISGDGGTDTIYGGSGDDTITGVGGNETIRAGSGNDNLTGGAGGDSMWGGTGQDDFIFAIGDSTAAQRDRINDFSHAEDDNIDLTAFANFNAGDWIGEVADPAALTPGALGYVVNLDGSLTVYGDHDGNGTADFSVDVVGVGSLQTSDFLFGP